MHGLGYKPNIHIAYSLKFRRKLVTMAIDKGIPIEKVHKVMGVKHGAVELLSKEQISVITSIIIQRCDRHLSMESWYADLYYEPYAKMRSKHNVTASVLSGFRPDTCEIDGITIKTVKYGLAMAQPELRTESGIFHIYSDGNNFRSEFYKKYCNNYNSDICMSPIYAVILFSSNDKGLLSNIKLCIPDKIGKIVNEYSLYKRASNVISVA